jgi:hypothetical protein
MPSNTAPCFIAKQLNLHLHAGFAAARQTVEIAAQRPRSATALGLPLIGAL